MTISTGRPSRRATLAGLCCAPLFARRRAGAGGAAQDRRADRYSPAPTPTAAALAAVLAAQMAVKDFGGAVHGRTIEIVVGRYAEQARRRLGAGASGTKNEGVAAIVDLPVTPVAFAVQTLAKQMDKTGDDHCSATSDITSKACAPQNTHWGENTHALARRQSPRV